jgi:hypothetical protein
MVKDDRAVLSSVVFPAPVATAAVGSTLFELFSSSICTGTAQRLFCFVLTTGKNKIKKKKLNWARYVTIPLLMLAFNLKSLNNNASALIEARGQSASAGVRSALENVQDLHYYAESPLGHVMRYVLALTNEIQNYSFICQIDKFISIKNRNDNNFFVFYYRCDSHATKDLRVFIGSFMIT